MRAVGRGAPARSTEALPHAREAHAGRMELFGPTSDSTLQAASTLLRILAETGGIEEGRELGRAAIESAQRHLGESHPVTQSLRRHHALLLQRGGDLGAAEALALELCEEALRTRGESDLETSLRFEQLGAIREEREDFEGAEEAFERSLLAALGAVGEEHPRALHAQSRLAALLGLRGQLEDALELNSAALETAARALTPDHLVRLFVQCTQAELLEGLGRKEEAKTLLAEASSRLRASFGEDDPKVTEVRARLARLEAAIAED